MFFSSDKRRQSKIDYQIKSYYRKCTKFFSRYDFETKSEDFLLMNRSFRCYQEGEQVMYGEMTLQEVKDYLVMKGQMMEQPEQEPKERRGDQPYVQLT